MFESIDQQAEMNPDLHTPKALSTLAGAIYKAEPNPVVRLMQTYRPYICPFDAVIGQVLSGASVLDVGCGSGLLLLMMASLDKISDGHGFDISEKAISVAQRAAEANKLGDRLTFESRGAGMALPEGNWSVVTLVDVLHHVPRAIQKSFFLSVCESVPDGGRLIVKDMVDRPRWRALANGAHDLVLARDVVNHVSAKEVSEWGASAGLETIHKGSRNTLWYGHWSLAFARGGA